MTSPSEAEAMEFLEKLEKAVWKLLDVVKSHKSSLPQAVKDEVEKIEKLVNNYQGLQLNRFKPLAHNQVILGSSPSGPTKWESNVL